jgi:hypothetical protein
MAHDEVAAVKVRSAGALAPVARTRPAAPPDGHRRKTGENEHCAPLKLAGMEFAAMRVVGVRRADPLKRKSKMRMTVAILAGVLGLAAAAASASAAPVLPSPANETNIIGGGRLRRGSPSQPLGPLRSEPLQLLWTSLLGRTLSGMALASRSRCEGAEQSGARPELLRKQPALLMPFAAKAPGRASPVAGRGSPT